MTRTTGDVTVATIEDAIGVPFARWAHHCHAISLAIVKARIFPVARVARGVTVGVGSQHSWIVLGTDCYDPDADVYDPTLWSYVPEIDGIWTGTARERPHLPHGSGLVYNAPMPRPGRGLTIELTPPEGGWSSEARAFLSVLGPLDIRGWLQVANLPVQGWPAAEILGALDDDRRTTALVPIDVLGMLTDRNPQGLYLP